MTSDAILIVLGFALFFFLFLTFLINCIEFVDSIRLESKMYFLISWWLNLMTKLKTAEENILETIFLIYSTKTRDVCGAVQ